MDAIYGERAMEETLGELERLGARVIHGVDAGNLRETLPETVERGTFDAAIWNFPCVARDADGSAREAALGGFDARSAEELEANRALVERFVAGASEYVVKNGGEIHVTHKVGMQCDWGIESAAATTAPGVVCAGAVVFDRMSYPGVPSDEGSRREEFSRHGCAHVCVHERRGWRVDYTRRKIQVGEQS